MTPRQKKELEKLYKRVGDLRDEAETLQQDSDTLKDEIGEGFSGYNQISTLSNNLDSVISSLETTLNQMEEN